MNKILSKSLIVSVFIVGTGLTIASSISGLTTFNSGDALSSAAMNSDFSTIQTAVNDNAARTFAGNGSAGNLDITSNTDWTSTPPSSTNFANCSIATGAVLTVPSGTHIRCSGTFTNDGTISVSYGVQGSRGSGYTAAQGFRPGATPHPGESIGAPVQALEYQDNGSTSPRFLTGGYGGVGLPMASALQKWHLFSHGGGGGAAGSSGSDGVQGGGLLKIFSASNLINNGTISSRGENAAGATGDGGGGGGIVILASLASIDNTGTIDVRGGNGGNSTGGTPAEGCGGGGGGGIVGLISPSVTAGSSLVTGGLGGTPAGVITADLRMAGAGGGGSGGDGGDGGFLNNTASVASSNGVSGGNGYVMSITQNPAMLIH